MMVLVGGGSARDACGQAYIGLADAYIGLADAYIGLADVVREEPGVSGRLRLCGRRRRHGLRRLMLCQWVFRQQEVAAAAGMHGGERWIIA
jgi:hypothetical protein